MEKIVYKKNPRKWTDDKIKFLKDNYNVLSYREISDKLGFTYAAISHKAHRLGLDSRKHWTDEENQIIRENYWCNPEVWNLLPNRSREAICVQARKLGVKRECGRYPINFRFFEEWTPESAYVVGFLIADGCVEPHLNRISCELSMKDYEHLRNIRNLMSSRNPICIKKSRYSCALFIHNRKMVNDIIGKGVIPNKTYRARLPYVPNELFNDLLRGYIDGDGSLYYSGSRLTLRILGNEDFLTDVRDRIAILYNIDAKISEHNKSLGTRNCYRMQYCSKKAALILNDIYYDNCFALNRKLALARGAIPGKINPAQISQADAYSVGEPERKTDYYQISVQRLHAGPSKSCQVKNDACKGDGIVRFCN